MEESSNSDGGEEDTEPRPSSSAVLATHGLRTTTAVRVPPTFVLSVTGSVESAEVVEAKEVYCKYTLVYGQDWHFMGGLEEGVSQLTQKDSSGHFVWNFPLEMSFQASNPHGWPQIVICVYGSDFFGNHVARGYGATHIPLSQGSFTKILRLFVPESSSLLQRLSACFLGRRPEFVDPKAIAQHDGRQLVRVTSCGEVRLKMEVLLKGLSKLGYVSSPNVFQDFP